MLKLKPQHWLGLALLSVSLQVSAQAYYPYNVADYPSGYDSGYYSQGGYPAYDASYGSTSGYDSYAPSADAYYATPNSGQQYYPQQSGYSAQQYQYGYAQQAPAYGYAQPGYYPPQAYYGGYPSRNSNGMKRMFKPEKWRGRNFGEEFWPGDDSIYEDVLPVHGPWDRNWGKAPWNREYEDMWGDEGGPEAWMDFADPKEGLAWMWEDFLYTPHALGTMPGGWDAPTISVPNPVDVGDEFKNASGDFPGEVRDFADGFTFGDRTMTGSKPKQGGDSGSFGFGNKDKKKDGINIQPKTR